MTRNPRVIKDLFAQCEVCKTWLRLPPPDDDDPKYRTVPLLSDPLEGKKWVCDVCWDKRDPYQHEELWDQYEKLQGKDKEEA